MKGCDAGWINCQVQDVSCIADLAPELTTIVRLHHQLMWFHTGQQNPCSLPVSNSDGLIGTVKGFQSPQSPSMICSQGRAMSLVNMIDTAACFLFHDVLALW